MKCGGGCVLGFKIKIHHSFLSGHLQIVCDDWDIHDLHPSLSLENSNPIQDPATFQ